MKNRETGNPGGVKLLSGAVKSCLRAKRAASAASRAMAVGILAVTATAGAALADWSNPSVSLSLPADGACIAGPNANNTTTQIQIQWTAFNNDPGPGRSLQLFVWDDASGNASFSSIVTNAPTGQLPLETTTDNAHVDFLVGGTNVYYGLVDDWNAGSIWSTGQAPYDAPDVVAPGNGVSGYTSIDMTTDPDCLVSPEISVTGNGVNITDGDSTPQTGDQTDFGSVDLDGVAIFRSFTITNSGTGTLTLGSNAASLSGPHAADFAIAAQPATSVASGGGTTTVSVRFDPSALGARSATLTIANDDADESPFNFTIRGTGVAPEIAVTGNGTNITDGDTSPTTGDHTDFGSADISGSTVSRTFTITNTGSAPLSLGSNAASLSGTHAGDFSITSQPATSVTSGGGTTTVTVRFDPSVLGTRNATLSIANNDSNESPFNFSIRGTGTGAPEISVTGDGMNITDGDSSPTTGDHTDFGSAEISGSTVSRTFTITNSGTDTLTLGSNAASLSGSHAADFSITVQPSTSVAAGGGTTTVTVRFDPSVAGARNATLSIANDDSDESPFNFAIQGTGTAAPEISVTGNGLNIANGDGTPRSADHTDFGAADIDPGTVSRTFTITNSGSGALTLGSNAASLSGDNAADFAITSQPATSVAADGGSTTVTVQFDPSALGTRTAVLSIANDDSDESPFIFVIRGTGTGAPEIAVTGNGTNITDGDTTPASADHTDFGSADIDTGTVSRTFTITNSGSDTLVLGSGAVSVTGASHTDFSVTTQPAATVAAGGGSTTFTVQFNPSIFGTHSATLSIANNDADEAPFDFAVRGRGEDLTAPAGYSVSFDQDTITAATANAVSFTFAGAEVGADYDYTIDGPGGASVTGSGTIATATDRITGIDVSSLPDGPLLLTVTLTDDSGNEGSIAFDSAPKDTTAPSGYAAAFDQDPVSAANDDAVSFTFAGAEAGATYDYTITTSGGGGSVTGLGTITSAGLSVSGIDVSGLADGTLTLSTTLTDGNGNSGTPATDTVEKDTVAPSGYTVTLNQDPVTSANQAGISLTIASGEAGAAIDYSIGSSGGGAQVTGSGTVGTGSHTLNAIDVSGLNDGTLTVSVTLTDPAGNAGAAATDTATKDTSAPTGYSASFDPAVINSANEDAVAFTFAAAEAGAGYSYSISSSSGGSPVVGSGSIATATDQVSGIDVSGLPDGTLTLSVTLTDSGGNAGSAATDTVTKDTTAPSGYSVSFDQNPVSAADDDAVSFTFAAAEVGADYSYTISSSGGAGSVTGSGTLASATDRISGLDVSGLADGTLTLSVTLTDSAGNTGAATTDTAGKDTIAPTVAITGPAGPVNAPFTATVTFSENVTGFAVGNITVGNGAASNFQTVSGSVYTATITPASDGAVTVDVTSAVASDAAGNDNAAATQFTVANDQTAPTVAITGPAGPLNAPFTATVTFSESVTGFVVGNITVGNGAASNFAGSGTTYTATITPAADGPVTVDVAGAVATDAAGNNNTAATQFSVANDQTAPRIASIARHNPAVEQTAADALTWRVTFSEAVSGVDAGDFAVSGTTATIGNVASLPGNAYDVTVSGGDLAALNGTVVLSAVTSGGISDAAGNGFANAAPTGANDNSYVLANDVAAPEVMSILRQSPAAATTNADTLTWRVSFSETVENVDAGDFAVGGSTASVTGVSAAAITPPPSVAGDSGPIPVALASNAFDVTVSGGDLAGFDGTVSLAISPAHDITDGAGNALASPVATGSTQTYLLDNTAPVLTIASDVTPPVAAAFTVSFTFSEDVSGFDASDIAVTGGSVTGFTTGDARTYSATITPAASASVTINVASGAAIDAAGNGNTAESASFASDPDRTVTIGLDGLGSGRVTSNPAGIDCGTACTADFDNGTALTLTATADAGSRFAGWTAGPCTGEANSDCAVTVTSDMTATARFILDPPPPGRIVAATLPAARSGYVGGPVMSAFVSVVSRASSPAQSCAISAPDNAPVTLVSRALDANGAATGPADPLFDIEADGIRHFVMSLTPLTATGPGGFDFTPVITCENATLDPIPGVNSVLLVIDTAPVPDIISVAATPSGDGVIRIAQPAGTQVMTASAINIGEGDGSAGAGEVTLTARIDTGSAVLPLGLEICPTDTASNCQAPRGATATVVVAGNTPAFFAVFAQDESDGTGIPFDPANARVFLRFADANGMVRSVTSAAVTAPAAADMPALMAGLPVGQWSVLRRPSGGDDSLLTRSSLFVLGNGQAIFDDGTTVERVAVRDAARDGRFTIAGLDGQWTATGTIRAGRDWAEGRGAFWGVRDDRSRQSASWAEVAGRYHASGAPGQIRVASDGAISGVLSGCIIAGQATQETALAPGLLAASVSVMSCPQAGSYAAVINRPANADDATALLIANDNGGWRLTAN